MDRIVTQMTKDDIAEVIKTGLPADSKIYYFNPDQTVGSSNYVRLYPVDVATIANAMSDDACFIKVVSRNVDDDEDSFDDSDDEYTAGDDGYEDWR